MTTLVTFLGTGSYKPLDYVFENKRYYTPYVAKALQRIFQTSEIRVLATEKAEETHGAALAGTFSVPLRFIRIPEGGDPDTLREQFAIFLKALEVPEDEPLIVDITHGFRAQPFFAATALAILQAAGHLPEDTRIVYGAAPTPPREGDEAPIWDLSPFLHRLQEAFGVITFLRTGDAGLLIEALEQADSRLRKRAYQHGKNPSAFKARGLITALKQFSTELQLLRVPALTIGIGDPQERKPGEPVRSRESSSSLLLAALREYGDACRKEHPALALLLEEIRDVVAPLACETLSDETGHRALLHLARLFFNWGQYAEAANVAREGLICLYASGPEGTDASRTIFSTIARQRAEQRFIAFPENRRDTSIRNIIEHCDFREYGEEELKQLANWKARSERHPLVNALKSLIDEFARQVEEGPRQPGEAGGRTIFVTRHAGAREWAERQGLAVDEVVDHLDPETIKPGDIVIGTLPVHLVAGICQRGGHYLHLVLNVPPEARGRELSADDMKEFGATLQEFRVTPVAQERNEDA